MSSLGAKIIIINKNSHFSQRTDLNYRFLFCTFSYACWCTCLVGSWRGSSIYYVRSKNVTNQKAGQRATICYPCAFFASTSFL